MQPCGCPADTWNAAKWQSLVPSNCVKAKSHDTGQRCHGDIESMADVSKVSKKETESSEASSLTLSEKGTEADGRLHESL